MAKVTLFFIIIINNPKFLVIFPNRWHSQEESVLPIIFKNIYNYGRAVLEYFYFSLLNNTTGVPTEIKIIIYDLGVQLSQ